MAADAQAPLIAGTLIPVVAAPDASLLLSGLQETERLLLAPLLTLVALEPEQVLYEA